MNTAVNPILPGYEYIPDGEPYVFDGRIYVYGSHDRFNGRMFCLNDYVCWSAPADNAVEWRYEGVIYRKRQDPKNRLGLRLLFAPDVVRGNDRRFYLYYGMGFSGLMGVAVADTPVGPFEFYGHVRHADGTPWGRKAGDSFPFDPAVINDDGRIYLYSGFGIKVPAILTGFHRLGFDGGYAVELESDMLTLKGPEQLLFPRQGEGSFSGHEFFEASSVRKLGNLYYFVYSSIHNHELCYATSDHPLGPFEYGGVLVSNADIGLPGVDDENLARNYSGNNHGGMLQLGDQLYIFHHRHTNRTSYSRQVCVERLEVDESGRIGQAEMTSYGMHCGGFDPEGAFEARIACNLWSAAGTGRYDSTASRIKFARHPYFRQNRRDGSPTRDDQRATQYIANMRHGAVAGFKYFDFSNTAGYGSGVAAEAPEGGGVSLWQLKMECAGRGRGFFEVFADAGLEICVGTAELISGGSGGGIFAGAKRRSAAGLLRVPSGRQPLYFRYRGTGAVDFIRFTLSRPGVGVAPGPE